MDRASTGRPGASSALLLALALAATASGCEGALVLDVGGSGDGPRQVPRIDLGDGGAPGPLDDGSLPAPLDAGSGSCDLPPGGLCDGDIVRSCVAGEPRATDCSSLGRTCRVAGGIAACVDPAAGTDAGTVPDPVPDPPPGPTGCASAFEQEVIDLANGERGSPLSCDADIARAARKHSQDMCDQGCFAHESQDGRSPFDRMREEGASFGAAAENIAQGQPTPASVHGAWMNSPGHRRNILGAAYRRIGVGHVECGGRHYWTQDFAD